MANLRSAMDAAFWDLNIATPQTINGFVHAVPGETFPLDGTRASRALRVQQLSTLCRGFPLGIIPSYHKDLGGFSLQSILSHREFANGWLALLGQFSPMKIVSSVKAEMSAIHDWNLSAFKNIAMSVLDNSLKASLCSQISLAASSVLFLNIEGNGEMKGCRTKALFTHVLPFHAISLEAATPEMFVDHQGQYWDLPMSISLDISSLVFDSGLRYRFGLHSNNGDPQAVNVKNERTPFSLMPGICAKAGFCYEKGIDLWRQEENQEDHIDVIEDGRRVYKMTTYDVRLREPHAALSAVFGGTCAAWFKKGISSESVGPMKTILDGDFFSSLCFTFQHGKYEKFYGDLTRFDARVNICSGLALAKKASNKFRNTTYREENTLSSPRLNLVFQQQVAGPLVFRADSKISLDPSLGGKQCVEDCIVSLNYAVRQLMSGRIVAWYSPMRKEGMIELRIFDF